MGPEKVQRSLSDACFAAHVWLQDSWNGDRTILLLVVFHHRYQGAPHGHTRPIQCMQWFRLSGLRISPARFHATSLECLNIAARGYFPILLLTGHPDFQVIGFCRSEAHVSRTQDHDAIWQLQKIQNQAKEMKN